MDTIIYTYNNQVYGNLTNKCDCACTFCIRSNQNGVGDAESLWLKKDPTLEEIFAAIDAFDFTGYSEFVFCGYGEPTCALNNLLATAKYLKEKVGIRTRLNTNGLGNLYHKKDIIPELAKVIDRVSISLNAPTEEEYNKVTRPQFEHAFPALLDFAKECQEYGIETAMSVVDVLPKEDIKAARKLAENLGVRLRVRVYENTNA